ncbi:hypothetical protein C9374_006385 [Naegleria lovaniensis]|uniref:Uncharacterized protein n=1 Tax=Naegleria lovaniensis TaxID=51637 RepID=A0AA88KMF2_NAELO|nr:uncharacterized protein C9374_006385 [Naegleria lovaniensis]KAG2381396.1 hypothetical protein C9374_006385 [Naegleria lovaniensis]
MIASRKLRSFISSLLTNTSTSISDWIKTLYGICQWIWNFLNNIQFNHDDLFSKTLKIRKTLKTKQSSTQDEHINCQNCTLDFALDPRWIPLQSSDSMNQKFKFNFDKQALSEINQTFHNTNEKLSSISIQELITNLQHLNKKINFSTNISAHWLASSNLSGNQKQRKLRQIKHDLYMAKRRNKFRSKIYEQKYLILNGKKPPGRNEDMSQVSSKDEDIMLHVYKKQLERERNQKKEFHIIQDFDFIQQMYREALQDAIEIEYEQSLFTQKSMEEIEKENETLQSLVHSYFYGVKHRDDLMRNVNKELFMDYQDDPFLLAFPNTTMRKESKLVSPPSSVSNVKDIKKSKTIETNSSSKLEENISTPELIALETTAFVLPKLGCLSMRNELERHHRRVALLRSDEEVASSSEIEHQRIASVLAQLIHNNNKRR